MTIKGLMTWSNMTGWEWGMDGWNIRKERSNSMKACGGLANKIGGEWQQESDKEQVN